MIGFFRNKVFRVFVIVFLIMFRDISLAHKHHYKLQCPFSGGISEIAIVDSKDYILGEPKNESDSVKDGDTWETYDMKKLRKETTIDNSKGEHFSLTCWPIKYNLSNDNPKDYTPLQIPIPDDVRWCKSINMGTPKAQTYCY